MANVSGHVQLVKRKRGDKWYAKYRVNGRQHMKLLGPAWTEKDGRPKQGYFTRKTAKAALDAILTDARRGGIHDPRDNSGKTFGDAVAEWLRYVGDEKARRGSTVRDYTCTAESALEPEFGTETPLEKITAERIDEYRLRLLTEGELSRRTIQKRMTVLGGILKRAVRLKWIQHNPLDEIEKVNVPATSEFNVLSPVQVEAVARKAEDPLFAAAIVTAAYTGLRAGELRALRWRDIDFAGMSVRVARSFPTGGELGPPKSGHARSVPLTDDAARELEMLSRRHWFTGADDFVFCDRAGERLGDDTLRDALYAAMRAADIDRNGAAFPAHGGFTLHDLRHTFGTLAVQVWPLHDVQAFMGHADIQTTMIYVHHLPRVNAAQQFTDFIRREKAGGETVSPTISRTTEIQEQRPAPSGTEDVPTEPKAHA